MTMVCPPPSLRLGILGLFACLSFSAQAAEPRLVIHAGALLDGTGAPPRGPSTVVLDGSRIEAVMPGHQAPAPGDEVLDLRGHTVMPGLIDMHVHLRSESNPRAALDRFRLNPEDHVLRAAKHARTTLNAGFTTVRDLGGAEVLALRDAINGGWAEGPRIFAAGRSIATTGGHADPTNGGRHDLWETPGPAEGVINGTVEARAAVRQRYKDGSDVIKVTATGGVLSQAKNGQNPQFALDELKAIVETARDYGFHVAAHAHGEEGMRRAVLAGVTSIEHGTFMSDEVMALMRERGTWYVPTIIAGKFVAEKAEIDGFFSEVVRPKARAIGPLIQDTFARAYAQGVPIVFGTDTGVSPHGDNWKEFGYMVEAGMPPLEALTSAMSVAAGVLGQGDQLGQLAPGFLADVIAVEGDPLSDIGRMSAVSLVIKDGEVVRYESP